MRRFGDGPQIARIAEKIRRLDNHAARLVVDCGGNISLAFRSGANRTIHPCTPNIGLSRPEYRTIVEPSVRTVARTVRVTLSPYDDSIPWRGRRWV